METFIENCTYQKPFIFPDSSINTLKEKQSIINERQ